jgi:hypothetical protein
VETEQKEQVVMCDVTADLSMLEDHKTQDQKQKQTNSVALSPQANYTD